MGGRPHIRQMAYQMPYLQERDNVAHTATLGAVGGGVGLKLAYTLVGCLNRDLL